MAIRFFRAPSRAVLMLLLLVFFSMSIGANVFNPKALAHELDHDRQTHGVSSAGHDHEQLLGAKSDLNTAPLDDVEHQFLHFACHFQPLLASSNLDPLGESPVRETPMLSRVLPPPPVELEPPFRPPRNAFRT